MNKEGYSPLVSNLTQLYDRASLPTALVDSDLQVLWANRAALTVHPSFRLPDGLRVILPESFTHAFFEAVDKAPINVPMTFPLPMLNREVSLLPIGTEGLLLFHSTLVEPVGTPFQPEGTQRLLATFSNQFRLPLSAIFSTLSTLRGQYSEEENPGIGDYFQRINTYCYQMLRGYMDITAYIQQQTGATPLREDYFDLTAHLQNLCEALRIVTGSVGIPLEFDLPKEPIAVCCDQQLLTHSILQLVANSCRFTQEDNAISLSLRATDSRLLVTIRDRGVGIPADLLGRVFEPYFSYDHRGTPVAGMGLGLTLAKYAITLQGGTIAMQSQVDEGTTVTFTLPRTAPQETIVFSAPATPADYLYDRFSLVHILLSDSVQPPRP